MSEKQFFLPIWDGQEICIFTNRVSGSGGILEWIAVAKAPNVKPYQFSRTGRMKLTDADLDKCVQSAEKYGGLSAGEAGMLDATKLQAAAQDPLDLLEFCALLNLMRKYAVDMSILNAYAQNAPGDRFALTVSMSVNKLLLNYLHSRFARQIIAEDVEIAWGRTGTKPERAEYFRSAAVCAEMIGELELAERCLKEAILLSETEDKHRKLGDVQFGLGKHVEAIESFLRAEAMQELPVPAAFRLGKLLFEQGRGPEARAFLARAEHVFTAPVERMLTAIGQAEAEDSQPANM